MMKSSLMRADKNTIAEHNLRNFEKPQIVQGYVDKTDITQAEIDIFEQFRASYEGKRVLDVGVGGGRTTPWLAPSSKIYIGIDYSYSMVKRCRERFPKYCFEHADARDLSRFEPGQFDFVLFSANGIDHVNHINRLQILKEIARVLVQGGVYAFSSHNLDWALTHSLWHNIRRAVFFATPLQAAKELAHVGWSLVNYARHSHMQVWTDDYAILLDRGTHYALPIYHVKLSEQRRQLQEVGFDANAQLFSELPDKGYADRRPYSFYYVTRKL
jgi:SAM-dependent methyltransferase